jgi:hypothetical protein
MIGRVWCLSATIAALAVGILMSGCGGGSSQPVGHNNLANATTSTNAAKSATQANQAKRHGARHRPPRGAAKQTPSVGQALNRMPASKRAALVQGLATTVFSGFGFSNATLHVASGGNVIQAAVPAADACSATANTDSLIAGRIRQSLPFVQSVQISVGNTGIPLSKYLSDNCANENLPGGRGPVVLTQRAQPGTTFGSTRQFTVHSSRWTVEYVNPGKVLQILPMRGSAITTGVFTVAKRGAGRRVMTGAGTYTLRIAGLGAWVVRVRDGA